MAPTSKNAKAIFKTSSPFTETTWPQISHDDQDIILDLVCNLVGPLGDHRRAHVHPSKGKKRKRKSKEDQDQDDSTPPPAPEIHKHILVGINSITRHLEALAALHAPSTMPNATSAPEPKGSTDHPRPLSMILLTHPKPSTSPAHAHFPTLVHLSNLQTPSSSTPTAHATRLIPLASSTDARLASTLHIPRVGALAIFAGAPGTAALEAFVQQNIDVTACAWLDEAMAAEWRGINVKAEASKASSKKN